MEAILHLVEANRNGARVVLDLRAEQKRLQRIMEPELDKQFQDLGHWIAVIVEGQGGAQRLTEADRPADEGRVMAILRRAGLAQWTKEHLAPIFEKQWRRALDSTSLILNKNQIPAQVDAEMARGLLMEGARRIGLLDIEEDTKRALMNIIEVARKEGINPLETAKMIEDQVPAGRFVNAGPRYRSELIARTETMQAQRASSLELYKQSPIVRETEAFDGDGDAVCAARNGQIYSFEDAVTEMNNTHPNCVLAFGPVV